MDRFTRTLLTSIGGGILLGAGLKLGEARASTQPRRSDDPRPRKRSRLAGQMRRLEDRLRRLETQYGAAQDDRRLQAMQSVQSQIARLEQELEELSRESPPREAPMSSTRSRSAGAAETGVSQHQILQRIAKLEEQSSAQAADVQDLKECAARTEKSVQRLVAGLDRWMAIRPQSRRDEE